jgi:hypothetical protein
MQRIAKVYQLNLKEIPLTRALLFACVPEKHLFLDVQYLQKNKQSGLCFTVPVAAMAVTRGGVVIIQYLQVSEKILTTEGNQWNVKLGNNITPIPTPFATLEVQARIVLNMLKQAEMINVPVHTYVVLLNERTQVLQPREDLIYPMDVSRVVLKLQQSKLLTHGETNRVANILTRYQYKPILKESIAPQT